MRRRVWSGVSSNNLWLWLNPDVVQEVWIQKCCSTFFYPQLKCPIFKLRTSVTGTLVGLVGDSQKSHCSRLSHYRMISSNLDKKVLFRTKKTVTFYDCHCNCCHCNRSCLCLQLKQNSFGTYSIVFSSFSGSFPVGPPCSSALHLTRVILILSSDFADRRLIQCLFWNLHGGQTGFYTRNWRFSWTILYN